MLELINITKQFDNFKLEDINLYVKKGDYFVLLGKSGAGKSLLLEIIAGMITADKGKIFVDGNEITHTKIQNRKVGLLYQDYALFPHLSVKENILYPLRHTKRSIKNNKIKIEHLIDLFEIRNLLKRKPQNISGGEKQRVALARTLTTDPHVLLLDEPLASLDIQFKQDIRQLLKKMNKQGQTILHVTHDYQEALMLSDKVAVIHQGEIIQQGKTEYVFHHPVNGFIANFTGIKNFFKVKIEYKSGETLQKALINNNFACYLMLPQKNTEGHIVIRSEDIIISDQYLKSSAVNNYKGKVEEIIPERSGVEVVVNTGIRLTSFISYRSFENLKITEGKKVWIFFKASAVRFLK